MNNPVVASVHDVSKRFVLHKHKSVKERVVNFGRARAFREDFWALRDISLDITAGSTVGLVGHNGSGKSTLLKMLGGIIEPTSGTISRRGRLAALLELGAGFHPDLTGRENVYLNAAILGLTQREIDRHFDAIVEFSGIPEFIDTQVKFYSSGMYVRLAFAVAVHVDPDVLLVDEVLAVGDEPFQRKCLEKIESFQREGRTIVLVSHSASQVGQLCDRVVVLDRGRMVHDGDPAAGIRILRNGYESERRQQARRDGVKTPTVGDVSIDHVDVEARETGTSTALTLDVAVDIREAVPGWGLGFAIENTLGMDVFADNTFAHEVALPSEAGLHRVRVEIPDLPLASGKYLVNIGVGGSRGEKYANAAGAASFDVIAAMRGTGLVRAQPSFSLAD